MKMVGVLLVDFNERFVVSLGQYSRSTPDTRIVCVGKTVSDENGAEPCARLKPDLVLMDLTMPRSAGLEEIESIMATSKAPPAVIPTIRESHQYRWASYEAGADGFLTKPQFAEKVVPLPHPLSSDPSPVRLSSLQRFRGPVTRIPHSGL